MFALTHSDLDEKTTRLLQAHQAAVAAPSADANPTKIQESAIEAADTNVHSEVPSGPTIELASKVHNAQTTATACQEPVSSQVSGINVARKSECQPGFLDDKIELVTTDKNQHFADVMSYTTQVA